MDHEGDESLDRKDDHDTTKCEEATKDLTDVIGNMGLWQMSSFAILFAMFFYASLHSLSYQFMFATQDHWCASPYIEVDAVTWRQYGVPNTSGSFSKCTMYDPGNLTWPQFQKEAKNHSMIVPCEFWYYDRSIYGSTVVSELNLVCGASNMASLTQSIFMLGFLLSAFIGGQIADMWGRKLGLQICLILLIPAQILSVFSRSLILICIARFITALGVSGSFTISYVLVAEVVGTEYRDILGVAGQCGWSIAYMLLPLLAWTVKNWVHLQYILTALTIPSVVLFFLSHESPRWLLTRGKGQEARNIISAACRTNRIYSEEKRKEIDNLVAAWADTKSKTEAAQTGNFLDQFSHPNIRKRTICLYFIWLTLGFAYYGLSYQSGELGADPYISVFLSALVELPAIGFSMFALRKLGRRNSILGELMVGGAACFLAILVPDRLLWLKISVAMVGKLGITACSVAIFIYTSELFPTVIRSIGMSWCNNLLWAGSIAAPFLTQLENVTSAAVPLAIFGAMSIASGFLSLLLPETKGRKVPDTVEEAENL